MALPTYFFFLSFYKNAFYIFLIIIPFEVIIFDWATQNIFV